MKKLKKPVVIWRVSKGFWRGREVLRSNGVEAEYRPGIDRWFVAMSTGIALIVFVCGLVTGHGWHALAFIAAISVPLGTLWFMLAPGQTEYSAGALGEAEAAVQNRPLSYASDWGSMPGDGSSCSGYGCAGGGGCGGD